MVLGLALISWNKKLGAIIDFKHPKPLNLSSDLINNVVMFHTFKKNTEEKLCEHEFDDKIILSYCDKSEVPNYEYEIIILIVHEKERIILFSLKSELISFAQSILKHPKELRNNYILTNIEKFFKKATEKKILILGRAGTGKSSVKKVVFEGHNPKDLVFNPLEPTRGLNPSIYSWLDLNLGFFDTSGQELNKLLDDEKERSLAFENASIVLYMCDYTSWNYSQNDIIEEIKKIFKITKEISYNAQLVFFIHKIDLIKNYAKSPEQEIPKINKIVKEELNIPLYFTSLYPKFLYSIYNAFCEILGMISPESESLKNLIDEKIKEHPQTMAFITNKNHSIVAQSISKDFDFNLINHIHELTAQVNQSFLDMVENDNINYFLMSSYKGLTIIMKHLDLPDFYISKIVCVSKILSNEQIVDLAYKFGIKIEGIQTGY